MHFHFLIEDSHIHITDCEFTEQQLKVKRYICLFLVKYSLLTEENTQSARRSNVIFNNLRKVLEIRNTYKIQLLNSETEMIYLLIRRQLHSMFGSVDLYHKELFQLHMFQPTRC